MQPTTPRPVPELTARLAELDASLAALEAELPRSRALELANPEGLEFDSCEALNRDWHRAADLRAQLLWVLGLGG